METESIGKIVTGRRPVTAALALRVARFVDVTFDDMVTGKYLPARTCPRCGFVPNEYEHDEPTAAEDDETTRERLEMLKWRLGRKGR